MSNQPQDRARLQLNRRVLVVDDNEAIHRDFRKILEPRPRSGEQELDELEAAIFGADEPDEQPELALTFTVDSAMQGKEALAKVAAARAADEPYALAFVDIRMPPGWDGIETSRRLWQADPALQVVVCSAYSDYSWEQMAEALGVGDRWVILKKPFDPLEVRQLGHALCRKWALFEENQRYVGQLEGLVRDRTRDLESTCEQLVEETRGRKLVEAELRRAQKLEALGRLAAGMGHEINNPLTYVLANIDFVTDALQQPGVFEEEALAQMREDLAHAKAGADRIGRIVQDMRIFSRMREEEERCSAIDLRDSLELSAKMVATEIRPRAQLVRDYQEGTPKAWGIRSRIEQVFVNLLINAAQALPEGRARDNVITLALRRSSVEDLVVVEVRDTGAGIPEEDLDQVFDPFFTRKAMGEGTGLGLSICHGIVSSLGGSIEIESAVGEGTCVRVILPVADERAAVLASDPPKWRRAQPADREGEPGAVASARPAGRQPRVLIVDDEELVVATIQRLLEPRCLVEVCHSGREALAICGHLDFDVVLCDLMMDDLTGMDLYDQIRRRRPEVAERFVFITGGAFTQRAEEFLEAVPNPKLAKPIDLQALNAMVDDLVRSRPAD